MATIFFILILLAGYHFVVEGIITPMLRWNLRFKLVRLRNKLIILRLKHQDKVDQETFYELNRIICITANYLPRFNLVKLFFSIKKIDASEKDEDFEKILTNKGEEIKHIYDKVSGYLLKAFLINSFGWVLYLSPFILILFITSLINTVWKDQIVKRLEATKEKEIKKILKEEKNCEKIDVIETPYNLNGKQYQKTFQLQ